MDGMSPRMIKLIVIAIAFVFVGVPALLGSWYTVPEGFRGVITRNGAVVGVASPGLGFKVPLIDGVTDMSVQTQAGNFEGVAAYSKDIQQARGSRKSVEQRHQCELIHANRSNIAQILDVANTVNLVRIYIMRT